MTPLERLDAALEFFLRRMLFPFAFGLTLGLLIGDLWWRLFRS